MSQDPLQFLLVEFKPAAGADSGGNITVQPFHNRSYVRTHLIDFQIRGHHPAAAIDIVANPAR